MGLLEELISTASVKRITLTVQSWSPAVQTDECLLSRVKSQRIYGRRT